MTSLESAIYNRISTKCHLFTKHYYPGEYKKLAAAAEEEYHSRKSRNTSVAELQKILTAGVLTTKSSSSTLSLTDENYWNDSINTTTCEAEEDISDIL